MCIKLSLCNLTRVADHFRYSTNVNKPVLYHSLYTFSHLDEIEQTSETPRHRVEPLRPGIRPSWVNKLSQVTVGEVAAATTTWWVVLLGDVAGGEMTNAEEVTGPLDVALLLGGKCGQARRPEALLDTLPSCTHSAHSKYWLVHFRMTNITRGLTVYNWTHQWSLSSLEGSRHERWVWQTSPGRTGRISQLLQCLSGWWYPPALPNLQTERCQPDLQMWTAALNTKKDSTVVRQILN